METLAFQAETKQLLQIVANSLYTDKFVFIRELISNAADALEKVRLLQVRRLRSVAVARWIVVAMTMLELFMTLVAFVCVRDQVTGEAIAESTRSLEIHLATDEKSNTITLSDSGVGMTRDELVSNLGTIARSGSKAFVEKLQREVRVSGWLKSAESCTDN